MSKPVCEVCGDRHWEHQAHVWPVANKVPVANGSEQRVANTNPNSWRVRVWREANRERYNARERERMKRKRKLEKESRDGKAD